MITASMHLRANVPTAAAVLLVTRIINHFERISYEVI